MARDGEKMTTTRSYDEENDIFVVHKGFTKDEVFKGNIDAGDLILDISSKGNVRGIEIMNASAFLGEFGITKDMLKSAEDGDFTAQVKPSGIAIGITITAKHQVHPAKIVVPQEIPV